MSAACKPPSWVELIDAATKAVSDIELVCFAPIVGQNLLDGKALKMVLDSNGTPSLLATGIHIVSSGHDEAIVQKIPSDAIANQQAGVSKGKSEGQNGDSDGTIENIKGKVFRLENASLADQLEALVSREWNSLHESHYQTHVYKLNVRSIKWCKETKAFVKRFGGDASDIDMTHEASIHIYLQQLWHSKRNQLIGKMNRIIYAHRSDAKSGHDHAKLARYTRELASFASFPVAQLYAVDLDDNNFVRGLIIQKMRHSVASYVDDSENVCVDLRGKSLLYEMCHALFDAVKVLHRCGVAHLDIKTDNLAVGCAVATPSNTSIDEYSKYHGTWKERRVLQGPLLVVDRVVKIIDMGSALIHHACYFSMQTPLEKNIFGVGDWTLHNLYGTARSTRGYMPPEVVLKSKEFARSFDPFKQDIYAIGVVVGGLVTLTSSWFNRYCLDDADYIVMAQQILETNTMQVWDTMRPDSDHALINSVLDRLSQEAGLPRHHFLDTIINEATPSSNEGGHEPALVATSDESLELRDECSTVSDVSGGMQEVLHASDIDLADSDFETLDGGSEDEEEEEDNDDDFGGSEEDEDDGGSADEEEEDDDEENDKNGDSSFETMEDDDQEEDGDMDMSARDIRCANAKAMLWSGPFSCAKCNQLMSDSVLGRNKLVVGRSTTFYANLVSHLDLSIMTQQDEMMTTAELLAAGSKSNYQLPDRVRSRLARIDCKCCIALLHAKKIAHSVQPLAKVDIDGTKNTTTAIPRSNQAPVNEDRLSSADLSERSVSLVDGELVEVPWDENETKKIVLTPAELAYDIDFATEPLPLMQLVTMFNLTMECFAHILLPWLSQKSAGAEALANIRLPALTELQKAAAKALLSETSDTFLETSNMPHKSAMLALDQTIIDMMLIAKATLKLQLSKLVSLAVLQYDVDPQDIWRWGVHQMVLEGVRETDIVPLFERRLNDGEFASFVTMPKNNKDTSAATATSIVEKFCWRWPNTTETIYALCTRGFKLAMVRWKRHLMQLLPNTDARLVAYPHMSDVLTYALMRCWSRVSAASSFEPSSRCILPRMNWHPNASDRNILIPSPLIDRHGFWNRRLYMEHVATNDVEHTNAVDALHHHRVLPLIGGIMRVFGGSFDLPSELSGVFGLDSWIPVYLQGKTGSPRKNVLSCLLSISHHDIQKYGPSIVWIGALSMFCQTRMVAKSGIDPMLQTLIDFLHLVACAKIVCQMTGLDLDGESNDTTWFRIARLLFTAHAADKGSVSIGQSAETLTAQITKAIELDQFGVSAEDVQEERQEPCMTTNHPFEPLFWYACEQDAEHDQLKQDDLEQQLFGGSLDPLVANDDEDDQNAQPQQDDDHDAETTNNDSRQVKTLAMYHVYTQLETRLKLLYLSHGIPPCPVVCFIQSTPGVIEHLVRESDNCQRWYTLLLHLVCAAPNVEPERIVLGSLLFDKLPFKTSQSYEDYVQVALQEIATKKGVLKRKPVKHALIAGTRLPNYFEQNDGVDHLPKVAQDMRDDIDYILERLNL